MGVYVYTLRAKRANVNIDGTKVKANLLSFAFKPFWHDDQPAAFKRMLTRAETYWEDRETPDVFVIGDKFENGCPVRKSWPKDSSYCYDSDFPGEHVGYLKKVGRTWVTVATEKECHGL